MLPPEDRSRIQDRTRTLAPTPSSPPASTVVPQGLRHETPRPRRPNQTRRLDMILPRERHDRHGTTSSPTRKNAKCFTPEHRELPPEHQDAGRRGSRRTGPGGAAGVVGGAAGLDGEAAAAGSCEAERCLRGGAFAGKVAVPAMDQRRRALKLVALVVAQVALP